MTIGKRPPPNPHRPATDAVNHPVHYNRHPSGIECIQITEHMGFNLGNAVKYIWRADLKADAIEDLKKARWYIDRELQKRETPNVSLRSLAETHLDDACTLADRAQDYLSLRPANDPLAACLAEELRRFIERVGAR